MSDAETYDSSDSVELPPLDPGPDINHLLKSGKGGKLLNADNDSYEIRNGHIEGGVQYAYALEEDQPYLTILEQPQARGFRFRYECEGPSHGGLQGEKSEKYKKAFPSIKIENYGGPARVVVSLVTDEVVPRPHAHKLVGKNCNDGLCIVEVKSGNNTIQFPNLCIQHVTRKKSAEVLEQRILESKRLDKLIKLGDLNANAELTSEDKKNARKQAEKQAKEMQLNVVKLCFQAYLRDDNGQFSRMLPSVVSNPIYDSKSPGANALKICRMDKYGGCCTGNEEVFLLCEKVQKDDILVRFVEQDEDGNVKWEAFGNFGPFDVHRQYAIVFKTPSYYDTSIDKAVNVLIMLQRKADQEVSEPKAFTYYPQNFDRDEIARKRKKTLPSYGGGGGYGPGSGMDGGQQGGMGFGSGGGSPFISGHQGGPQNGGIPNFLGLQTGNFPVTVEQTVNGTENSRSGRNTSRRSGRPRGRPKKEDPDRDIYDDLEQDSAPFDEVPVGQDSLPTILSDFSEPRAHAYKARGQAETPQSRRMFPKDTDMDTVDSRGFDEVDAAPIHMGFHGHHAGTDLEYRKVQPTKVCDHVDAALVYTAPPFECKSQVTKISDDIRQADMTSPLEVTQTDYLKTNARRAVSCPAKTDASIQTVMEADAVMKAAERTVLALQSYSATGDIRHLLMVQRFLTAVQDDNGDLSLHLAVINNRFDVVQNLLDVMVTLPDAVKKVNACNYLRQTALHLAVLTNQPGVIDLLIRAGANPMLRDRNGNTATNLAVLTRVDNCVYALLKYLRPGVTQDEPFPELNLCNYDGFSPAHLAAQTENLNAMRAIAYGKGDMDLPDGKSGRTPLHHAVEAEDLVIAGFLILEANADVNAQCFDGNTALHIACGRGNVGMVALLMAAGANPDKENNDVMSEDSEGEEEEGRSGGLLPVHFAHGNHKILRVLRGEPYSSISEIERETDERDIDETEEMVKSLRLTSGSQTESGLGSIGLISHGGDLGRIDYLTRVGLSKLLDSPRSGSDWLALASKLGLRQLLEGQQAESKTRLLLDYYEACGGTVARLIKALTDIGRPDAVRLVSSPVSSDTFKASKLQEQIRVDSGVDSLNLKSQQIMSGT